jgi:beta-glucosidase
MIRGHLRVVATAIGIAAAAVLPGRALAAPAPSCPWLDPALTANTRAHEVLAHMTLADKIAIVHQQYPFGFHDGAAGWIPANARLCIPDLVLNDGGAGVADIQTGTTPFPAPIAQAASWSPALQRELGQAIGDEAWRKGIDVLLAPAIEIDRTPLNGRNFEYFSEDPYLSGQAAAAEVLGIQSQHVIATIKHFIANSQETNRMTVSSDLGERTLHELYAVPYEIALKEAHPGSVMDSRRFTARSSWA